MSDDPKLEKELIIRIDEDEQEDVEEDIMPIIYEENKKEEKLDLEKNLLTFFRKRLIAILRR